MLLTIKPSRAEESEIGDFASELTSGTYLIADAWKRGGGFNRFSRRTKRAEVSTFRVALTPAAIQPFVNDPMITIISAKGVEETIESRTARDLAVNKIAPGFSSNEPHAARHFSGEHFPRQPPARLAHP